MNILQATFEKHKRLMLENLGVINEAELYHATDKDQIQSFIKNGVIPSMAGKKFDGAGKKQGEGFYVWKSRDLALNHAKEMDEKADMFVIIDQDVNIENFDVDYESEYRLVSNFILKHWDYFLKHWKELHIYHHIIKTPSPPTMKGVFKIVFDDGDSGIINATRDGGLGIDTNQAGIVWKMVQEWQKLNPKLFDEFEKESLPLAKAMKYNGKKKIWPDRIEDLQGNILWKKDK